MNNNNNRALTVTQRRLRDLAPRALQIVEEHKGLHPSLAATVGTVVPAAEAYIKVYDEAVKYRASQRTDMEAGRESLGELAHHIRSTLGFVAHALPAVNTSEIVADATKPDALISDGYKVLELLEKIGDPAQTEAVAAVIKAALEKAEGDWAKARTARVALQSQQAVVREHARVLNRALIMLRRVLRNVVGTSHLAYQDLRNARVATPEDEDDTVVEEEEEEIDPFVKTSEAVISNGSPRSTNGAHAANASLPTGGAA